VTREQVPATEAISHEQIMQPHCSHTHKEAMQRPRVLLLADTTDVNLSSHEATSGPGPIGRSKKGQGFFVHTVLARDSDEQQRLGWMDQEPFERQPAPKKETRVQKKKRPCESQAWERSGQAMEAVPEKHQWISAGDRGSDICTLWQACQHCR
jgi:hypothetical protein